MAIFHFSAQPIARGAGRSAVAAAAYRACEKLVDARTGVVHDFRRKRGRDLAQIFLPGGGTMSRNELWDAVEKKHKRGDAVVAREFEIGLPYELNKAQRDELVKEYCQELADIYRVGVDVGVHAPIHGAHKEHSPNHHEHDPRNFHAHIMMSACHVSSEGVMGNKCVEMDPIHCKRHKIENAVEYQRKRWQELCNRALEKAGRSERIDHRSHADRGLMIAPSQHQGPAVAGLMKRGESSEVAERQEAENYIKAPNLDEWIEASRLDVEAAEQELIAAQAEHDAEIQAQAEAAALAKAQAEAEAIAKAQAAAIAEAQAQADKIAKAQAAKIAKAHSDYAKAAQEFKKAEEAESKARSDAEALRTAWAEAIEGQRQAGKSIIKAAASLHKISLWDRAIRAYEAACELLEKASAAVHKAGKALAQAWANLMEADPSIRAQQIADDAAREKAHQEQIEKERKAKDAISARVRAHDRPKGWTPAKLPPETTRGTKQDPERDA